MIIQKFCENMIKALLIKIAYKTIQTLENLSVTLKEKTKRFWIYEMNWM